MWHSQSAAKVLSSAGVLLAISGGKKLIVDSTMLAGRLSGFTSYLLRRVYPKAPKP